MEPLLCLTKADLADPDELLATYRSLGVPWVVTHRGGDLTALLDRLTAAGSACCSGSSGVGKSTLVNALVPDAHARGRASSTPSPAAAGTPPRRRTCSRCPTTRAGSSTRPGIRSFGLAHVEPEDLIEAFPDLDEMTEDCPRGCTHGDDEPECGLDEAVEAGQADPERVASFRRLLAARSVRAGVLACPRPPGPRRRR